MIHPPADERRSRIAGLRRIEFLRFGAVGASSAALYLAAYTLAVLAGVPYVLASLGSFLLSATYGYLLHHHWTFRTNTPTRGGLARWLILQGAVIAVNIVALWALVEHAGVGRILAQTIILPVLPLTTYLLSRRRIFGA